MEDKKCILFVRVSTELQNFDEQEKELYQMAIYDGYLPQNIIAIAEKESGRKLSEEERKGITTLKKYIEDDNAINCVYLWEISRLARKQKVLMSIREYLIERKINIKIKTPACSLLNSDGTINDGADLIFSLYSQMSEAEMRTKIERFKRTKKVNSQRMKYSGGKIMFGYKVDENGYYQVDEEQAKIIRLIFDLYTTQNIGAIQLRKELETRGYHLKGFMVQKIIRNTAYVGYFDYPKGNYRKYPPIITQEIFDKAQEKKEENKKHSDKSRKNIWLCSKLIKCTECGGFLMANGGAKVYRCKAHAYHHFYKKNCTNNLVINISVIDGIAWHYAQQLYINDTMENKEKQIKDYRKQIEILSQKINAGKLTQEKIDEKEKRITEAYFDAEIDKKDYQKRKENIYKERKEHEIEIAKHHNSIQRLQTEIEHLEKDKKNMNVVGKIKEIMRMTASIGEIQQSDKYDIVHRYINHIEITDTKIYVNTNEYAEQYLHRTKQTSEDLERKAREIKIYGMDGKIETYFFMYTQKKWQQQFARYNEKTDRITPTIIVKQ